MKKKKRIIIAVICLLALSITAGIFVLFQRTKTEQPIEVVYIPKSLDESNEFWSVLIAGAQMAAKKYGADLTILAPNSEADIEMQNEFIEQAIAMKPDVIALSPSSFEDTALYAKKVRENGIPLVFIDSKVNQEVADVIVSTDNFRAGKMLGNYMRMFMPKEPHIAFVGHVEKSSTAIEREEGIRFGLEDYEDAVEYVVFCDSVYQNAYDLTMQLLEKYPEINMIVGFNEYSAVGAAKAVKNSERQKEISVFGIDSSDTQIQLLEEGIYKGIVIQNPFSMGYLGIEQAVKLATGKEVKTKVDSGATLITRQNIYSEENQKLLFPFIGKQATEEEKIVNE